MDALSIEAAEAAVACGYPEGAAAVLIVELEGPEESLSNQKLAWRLFYRKRVLSLNVSLRMKKRIVCRSDAVGNLLSQRWED